jgi:hypothetical protein
MEETNELKVGDYACFTWKKPDGAAMGASEGLFLGFFGDDSIGKFLVFDKSCYKDSFKTSIFSLGIHDLKIVPAEDVDIVNKGQLRERPPNFPERFRLLIDAFYCSNIDYQSTLVFLNERKDFKPKVIGNKNAEQYGISIKEINLIDDASINITCKGVIQIICQQKNLDDCIEWLDKAVKLQLDHKRLVLFPQRIMYRLTASFKEKVGPSEELMNQIASEEGSAIIMPLDWTNRFSSEADQNLLQGQFSDSEQAGLILAEIKKIENNLQNLQQINYNKSGVTVEKFLGDKWPIMHLKGEILSRENEEGLMGMWQKTRLYDFLSFDTGPMDGGQIKCKVLVNDLTINRKTFTYKVDIRTYSGNPFTNEKANKKVPIKFKS